MNNRTSSAVDVDGRAVRLVQGDSLVSIYGAPLDVYLNFKGALVHQLIWMPLLDGGCADAGTRRWFSILKSNSRVAFVMNPQTRWLRVAVE